MEINCNNLSDIELVKICQKYNIIQMDELSKHTRSEVIHKVHEWSENKMREYRQKKRAMSDPNIKSVTLQSKDEPNKSRTRRNSLQANPQKNTLNYEKTEGPPKSNIPYQRDRRMSEPFTQKEKQVAVEHHQAQKNIQKQQSHVKQEIDYRKYDSIGIYPPVKKLIAIGDVHGDLAVTLTSLRLAEVIPPDIFPYNVNKIRWTGGSTWIVQLGDQIDRCRPDSWKKNCIEDFSDVVDDEGSNMLIVKIFQQLDSEARKEGGRVLGVLGNHELMNIDKDYRYVSPKEFLEFVPEKDRGKIKYTDDGYPYGYYHRLKAFERGGNIAKHYAYQKKSIMLVGRNLFVHGGLSHALVSKYTLHEINMIVQKWLLKESNDKEEDMFDEIFRDDDDVSPFWCRLYSEDDNEGENTFEGFNHLLNIINKRNKLLQPIQRVVLSHTPQFMYDRYANGIYNDNLWRIDVGMSRAFGRHDNRGENKYRQVQILIITDDNKCEVKKTKLQGRPGVLGSGQNASLEAPSFLQ